REPTLNRRGSHGVARRLASGRCVSPFDSSPAESASPCWPRRWPSAAWSWPALTPTGRQRPPPPSLRRLPTPRCPCPRSRVSYRTNYGGFQNTRELVDILGMSEAEYLVARHYLTL